MEIPEHYNDKLLKKSWIYRSKEGKPLGIVGRYQGSDDSKDIIPFFKKEGGSWKAGIDLSPRPLFGLEWLETLTEDKNIFVVEGEKAASALHAIGSVALTSLGGSPAAKASDWSVLDDVPLVYLWPDNDEPGEHYVRSVYQVLKDLPNPPECKILRPSGLPKGGDAVDWLQGYLNGWDGYEPVNEKNKLALQEDLVKELAKASSIPDDWSFVGSVGSGFVYSNEKKPGEIISFVPDVPVMSNDLIPGPFKDWLSDVGYRMQTPVDFAVVSSLVITGSLIGSGCGVRPKAKDNWEVIPNLWGVCIGRPSVLLKTPSMKEPMRLLERLQATWGDKYEEEKKEAGFDDLMKKKALREVEKEMEKVTKKKRIGSKITKEEMDQLKADYLESEATDSKEAVIRRMFKTNETSIQSMTVLQNENPRGLLVFRDELMGLFTRWDKEDGQDERAYFLEGWNGNGSYTDVKIGRGLTDAKNICISLLGGTQPDKLKRYLYQAMKGNNDGLMQRLQLAVWPDEPVSWKNVDIYPDNKAKARAYEILEKMVDINFCESGASMGEYDERPYFRFSNAGQEVFNEWLTELQTVKIKNEENPLMAEHFGKFRSLLPSLALIFHMIDVADGQNGQSISKQSVLLAVQWCGYLEGHARRVYAMAEHSEQEAAIRLSTKIKEGKLPNPFAIREVQQKSWYGLKEKNEIASACELLVEENWVMAERKRTKSPGRPSAPKYHINPVFLSKVTE